ncbi:MAG: hypothetical protein WCL70_09175 [Paludibacter sp.]
MKKLIFFVLVCGVMSGCDNNNRYDLPKDKIPLLKNNEVVYFQDSASNKKDTLCLNIRDYWSQTIEQNYFRYIIVQYLKPNKKSTFLQTNITSQAESHASFSLLFSEYDFNTSIKSISYKVNGVTYPSVYVVNDNAVLQSDTIPKTVYFTYPNGIIRYEYKDGRVYNLVSK